MRDAQISFKIFALFFLIAIARYFPLFFKSEIYWLDSAVLGNFAYHFAQNKVIMPFVGYQSPPHLHGSFVVNILLIPFYYLSGPFYGWISFLGLLVSSSVFALSMALIIALAGERRFWAGAFVFLLFFFPPPIFTYHARTLCFSHFEISLLLLIALVLFNRMVRNDKAKAPLFIFGLFLGFSCFFCYSSFVFAVALTACAWVLRVRSFLKRPWVIVVGFLIGFSPAIIYNLIYLNVIWGKYLSISAVTASYPEASRGKGYGIYPLYTLFFKVMPRFFAGAEIKIQSVIFAVAFCASLFWLIFRAIKVRNNQPLELALLFTFVCYLAFYAFGPFAIFDYNKIFFYRYIVFLYPAMILIIALFLKRFGVLALAIAIVLATNTNLYFSYPMLGELSFRLKSKKGYDAVRLYTESMVICMNRLKGCRNNVASKAAEKLAGFERAMASIALGSQRFNLFKKGLEYEGKPFEEFFEEKDRKWFAFGWGVAQEACIFEREGNCDMPLPMFSSENEKKWFAAGFALRRFWGEKKSDNYLKEAEEILSAFDAESLSFALGFSASDEVYSLPPIPAKPKDHLQLVSKYLEQIGGLDDAAVRENFWRGVGCEIAFWFLSENFLMSEKDFEKLMTPSQLLNDFKPDAQSMLAGWYECLKDFGCKQTEEQWKIGKVIKVTCEGEKF